MFELYEEKSNLPADKERIARLIISLNEPMIAPTRHQAQPAHAYICTFKEDDAFSVYVYLYLTIEKAGILYRHADGLLSSDQCGAAEDEAVQFAEDMGFIVDDSNFERLFISEQEKLLAAVPLFALPEAEVKEGKEAEIEAVAAEEVVEPMEVAEIVPEAVVVEEPVREEKAAEKEEPELFLTKFRIRVAEERKRRIG